MNKRFSIASILLMTLCFTCHGWPVQTNSFDVNVNQQVERSLRIPQGEARVFDARFIDSSGSLNLTNMTAEYLYMRQMGTNWWTIPATIQSNSVLIAWDHTRDVGASRYYGWIRVGTTSSPIYRVQLDLAMIDTPGFTPNASALVIAPIDFAELSWTNAPWDAETNTVYGRQGSEWVEIGGGGTGDVISVFGRAGIVIADESDYAQFYAPSSRVAAIELWPTGNWSTAYGWGNHALGGYATGTPLYVESDPAWHSGTGAIWTAIGNAEPANYAAVSNAAITAHGWGDHSEAGYLTAEADAAALGAIGSATNALLDLAGTRAMTGNLNMGGRSISNVAELVSGDGPALDISEQNEVRWGGSFAILHDGGTNVWQGRVNDAESSRISLLPTPATATNSYIRPDGGTNSIYFDAASNMIVAVDGSPALTISPAGDVGVNVDEPEAQLDVGGDVLVRSNLVVRHGLQIGSPTDGSDGRIRVYNSPEDRFDEFGHLTDSSFAFGVEGETKYGFSMDGKFGGNVASPWYAISSGSGVVFGNSTEGTNRASIKVSVNPPGFIFNVNGVIWTNTP